MNLMCDILILTGLLGLIIGIKLIFDTAKVYQFKYLNWYIIQLLLSFFVVGYISFFFLKENAVSNIYMLLISAIFCGGGVFVALIAYLMRETGRRVVSALTDLKESNKELKYISEHDHLTNVFNRRQFNRILERTHELSIKYGRNYAVLFIDINDFKQLNDTLGHDAGDKVLEIIAERLLEALVRMEDCVARVGGDEFSVILTNIHSKAEPGVFAEKLLHLLSEPFHFRNKTISITVSIGIVCFPIKEGADIKELLRRGDVALMEAKNHRNKFQYFTPELNEAYEYRLKIEQSLKKIIRKNEISVVYQAQLELKTNRLIGAEVLARWYSPSLGEVPPDIFIPVAEEIGFINELGLKIVDIACKQYASWLKEEIISPEFSLAINISPYQLMKEEFVQNIIDIIDSHRIPIDSIDFELTETALIKNQAILQSEMDIINRHKIRFSIDDFGTGYSSLLRLTELPIDSLKIDCLFVQNIGKKKVYEEIIRAIISLSRSLKLKTIAEGIEEKEQIEFLIKHGCDNAQGFYFSKPLGATEMHAYLKNASNKSSPKAD